MAVQIFYTCFPSVCTIDMLSIMQNQPPYIIR